MTFSAGRDSGPSWFILVSLLTSLGCGGSNPSSDLDAPLGELSAAQYQDFCTWAVAAWGGEDSSWQCLADGGGDAGSYVVQSAASCIEAGAPQCSRDTFQACIDGTQGNACLIEITDACLELKSCLSPDGDSRGFDYVLRYEPPSEHNVIPFPPRGGGLSPPTLHH